MIDLQKETGDYFVKLNGVWHIAHYNKEHFDYRSFTFEGFLNEEDFEYTSIDKITPEAFFGNMKKADLYSKVIKLLKVHGEEL